MNRAYRTFRDWGRRRWTLAFVPHGAAHSRQFQISQFGLLSILLVGGGLLLWALLAMLQGTIRAKEVTRLEMTRVWHAENRDALAAENARLETELAAWRKTVAALGPQLPDSWQRMAGIGGRELSLSELSASLAAWNARNGATAGLQDEESFLRDAADLSRHLGKYVEKRKAFFSAYPSLYPVPRGLGDPGRDAGSARSLKVSLPPGTPIVASGDGVVVEVRKDDRGLRAVRIEHGYGFFTEYQGLETVEVEVRDKIKRGVALGRSCATLQYFVQMADTFVDPLVFSPIRAL